MISTFFGISTLVDLVYSTKAHFELSSSNTFYNGLLHNDFLFKQSCITAYGLDNLLPLPFLSVIINGSTLPLPQLSQQNDTTVAPLTHSHKGCTDLNISLPQIVQERLNKTAIITEQPINLSADVPRDSPLVCTFGSLIYSLSPPIPHHLMYSFRQLSEFLPFYQMFR